MVTIMAELAYPLPMDTVAALNLGRSSCSNPGLLFDRLCPYTGDGDSKDTGEKKKSALKMVRDCVPDHRLLDAFRSRWRGVAAALGAITFEARTVSRLVVGLGRKGPLEVGFAFNRYGFPIIPGSALKGLTRAAALLEKGGNTLDTELMIAFGRPPDRRKSRDVGCVGKAIFLDAIPAAWCTLELDLMNPHFPDYYRDERTPPTDWQNPTPVYFLAVGRNTPFLFAVGWRDNVDRAIQTQVVNWLRSGLSDLGVGAKTTAGYGSFVVGELVTPIYHQDPMGRRESSPLEQGIEEWRKGRVRVFRSDKGWGLLLDGESGKELRFEAGTIEEKGWTPGGKALVEYLLVEGDGKPVVTRVRRVRPEGS